MSKKSCEAAEERWKRGFANGAGELTNSVKERLKKCIYCYMMVLERAKPA